MLSALELPWFLVFPPASFGVLTTTGRRTGKTRRRCVRAIRSGDRVYLVAIGGRHSGWLKNALANPEVRLRIRGGTFVGVIRELRDEAERAEAEQAYCGEVHLAEYAECLVHRRGLPSRAKVTALHREWFEGGTPLVFEPRR